MSLLSPQLQAFMAIVEHKTVHAAARAIKLTQTGVTQRIRALESSLSTTLFIRSRRGMRLTESGHEILKYCQMALEAEGMTVSKIKEPGNKSEIRVKVVGPTSIMSSRIIPSLLDIHKSFSNLLFTFLVDDLDERIERLRHGEVHLAIVPPESVTNEMDSKLLKVERYLLVGSALWKGLQLRKVLAENRIVDFDESDKASFEYLKHYDLLDLVPKERHFVNNNESLVRMFSAGIGYGVLTKEVAKPYLESGEIITLNSGQVFESRLALAWYPRNQMPDYFKAILKAIK